MKIQQIIDEQMKEFDFSFYPDLVEMHINYRDSRKNITVATIDDFKSFILSYTRKLIEAVGEEIISEGERIYDNGAYGDEACEGDECHFESGYLVARDVLEGQQLKLKEIIKSLK